MLDAIVACAWIEKISLFPPEWFTQEMFDTISCTRYFDASCIPREFRTRRVLANLIKHQLLIQHNATNIRAVPRDLLNEPMMLTALRRSHAHLKSIPPASRTPAVLKLIRDNQAKPKRRKRRTLTR